MNIPSSFPSFRRFSSAAREGAGRASSPARRAGALLAAAAVVALAGGAARPATLGGQYLAAVGEAQVVLPKAGVPPATVPLNLRFNLAGNPEDPAGDGTVLVFDEEGQYVQAEFPCSWTTGRGAACRTEFAGEGFRAFAEDLVEGVVGAPVAVTIERAQGRGAAKPGSGTVRLKVQVRGTCSIGGGVPGKLKMTLRIE